MPAKIEQAESILEPLFRELTLERGLHPELLNFKVRIDWLIAYAPVDDDGNKTGPALTAKGLAALGVCRIVNYRDRVKGMGDVEISVDGDWWHDPERTHNQRLALLDHELEHIEVCIKSEGITDRDAAGRPKIKMRKHDFEVGWFHNVAERWKHEALEVQQAQELRTGPLEQVYFSFAADLFEPRAPKRRRRPSHPAGDKIIQIGAG